MRALGARAIAAALLLSAALTGGAANRGISHLTGDTETTALQPNGDVDTFVFDLPEHAALSITVKAGKGVTLFPALALVRPDGSEVDGAALAAKKYAPGKASVKLSGFAADQTGKWAARVSSFPGGQTGAYSFQTKLKYVSPPAGKGVTLPEEGMDIPVPLAGGAMFSFTMKRKAGGTGFEAPILRNPTGGAVPIAGSAWTVTDTVVSCKKVPIPPAVFGEYTLEVPGPGAGGDATVDYSIKISWPKRKPAAHAVSPDEPLIATFSPASGNLGTGVQVGGSNFAVGATFEIGGKPATNVIRNTAGTLLTGQIPSGNGTVACNVINPDGQENSLAACFTYAPPPTVTSCTPNHGPATGGTPVTIVGTNFRAGMKVYFAGVQVLGTVTLVNAQTLTLTTEPNNAGVVNVEVRDPANQPGYLIGGYTFDRLFTPVSGSIPVALAADVRAGAAVLGDIDRDSVGVDDVIVSTTTPVSDGAGGFKPASRVLRGNNSLGFVDMTASTFPGTFFPTIGQLTLTGLAASPKDYGYAGASALGDLDGDGNQDLVLCADGFFLPSNTWYFVSGFTGARVPSPNLSTTYYQIQYPGTRIFKNVGASAFQNTTMVANTNNQISMAMPVLRNSIAWGEFFQAKACTLADMDGDSDLDLILVTGDRVNLVQIQGSAGPPATATPVQITLPALRVFVNDLVNTGGTSVPGNFRFASNHFVSGWTAPAAGGESFQGVAVAAADVDSDGLRDVVVTNDVAPLTSGSPTFATRVLISTGTNLAFNSLAMPAASALDDGRGTAMALTDVTGDGKPDVVVTTPDNLETVDGGSGAVTRKSSTRVFKNDGGGVFTDVTATAMPAATAVERWRGHALSVVDMDKDGDLDLVIALDAALPDGAGGYLPATRILLNNGTGTFTAAPAGYLPAVDLDAPGNAIPKFRQGRWVLTPDLDADGDRDVVLGTEAPVTDVPAAGSRAPSMETLQNR